MPIINKILQPTRTYYTNKFMENSLTQSSFSQKTGQRYLYNVGYRGRLFSTKVNVTLERLLDSIILEGDAAIHSSNAEEYNYLPSANKTKREVVAHYREQCVEPIIARLLDNSVDGPAARVFLNLLSEIVPTRQTYYENILSTFNPSWKENPFNYSKQKEFALAGQQILNNELSYPRHLLDVVRQCSKSKHEDVVLTSLKFCELIGTKESLNICMELINSDIRTIKLAAIRSAARLSVLDAESQTFFTDFIFSKPNVPNEEKLSAMELAISTTPNLARKKLIESLNINSQQSLFKDPRFINCLLDMEDSTLKDQIERVIQLDNLSSLPDETLRRISRTSFLNDSIRKESSEIIFSSLEQNARGAKFGLVAHRNSSVWAGYVGHAGIFINETTLVHCTIGNDPSAVHKISFNSWKNDQECWGIREDRNGANLNQTVNRALDICSWRTEYDGSHNNQKGGWFKGWFCSPRYWEADCVGFTEHCCEYAGGNPTPREFEYGAGWPLTVREQAEHMRKVFNC